MPENANSYKSIRKIANFGADHNVFQSMRDIVAVIAVLGPLVGYIVLFVYCTQHGVPFFEAASDMGLTVAALSIMTVLFVVFTGCAFAYPAWIRKYDGFAPRLKALRRLKDKRPHDDKIPSPHWVNISRGIVLVGWVLPLIFTAFAFGMKESWHMYSMVFSGAAIISLITTAWCLHYLIQTGMLLKRQFQNGENTIYRSSKKIWKEVDLSTTFWINLFVAGMMMTFILVAMGMVENVYSDFGKRDSNHIVDSLIFVSICIIAVMPFLGVIRFSEQPLFKVFFWTAMASCSITFIYAPGFPAITKGMMVMTGKGGDIPVRLLIKKKVACGIGRDTIFNDVDWSKIDCSKTPKKEDVLVYSDVVYLALRTSDTAYVRAKKGKAPVYSIRFPADGVMEYGASAKTANDVQEEGEANDTPDNS
jgi:hypothetical protein